MKKILFLMAVFTVAVMGGELHDAARNGDLETVKKLATPATINSLDDNERSVLSCAAANGQLDVVKWLLKHGADPNLSNWQSPLSEACFYGHYDVARVLLEKGADPNFQTNAGTTPLSEAVRRKDLKLARMLIRYGADVGYVDPDTGETLLHMAASSRQLEMIQLLLSKGLDPNKVATNGWEKGYTPIFLVDDVDTALLLLDGGANPIVQGADGISPLMMACNHGRENIVCLLLQFGADPKMRDNNNRNAFDFAMRNEHTHVARLVATSPEMMNRIKEAKRAPSNFAKDSILARYGKVEEDSYADLPIMDQIHVAVLARDLKHLNKMDIDSHQLNQFLDNHMTPLQLASQFGLEEVVAWLLKHGADPAIRTPKETSKLRLGIVGWDAAVFAAIDKNDTLACMCINAGAPLDRIYKFYSEPFTLLEHLCGNGLDKAVATYIHHGGKIDQIYKYGTTPLMLAVKGGYADVVKILLENGADPGAKVTSGPMKGRTALDYARDLGYDEITNLLTAASSSKSE